METGRAIPMTRITEVQTHLLTHKLDEPFQSSHTQFDARTHCLVEIVCEDGTVGWGECLGPAHLNVALVKAMRPWLLGRDSDEIEPLWLLLYNQFRDQGMAGVQGQRTAARRRYSGNAECGTHIGNRRGRIQSRSLVADLHQP
jgi:L-alanine-DL-glutamate epimerase-like enolase superfamily enzyme